MTYNKLITTLALLLPFYVNASFYIDYQGLEKPVKVKEQKNDLITPNGYRLLTNDLQGIVYEIGKRLEMANLSNFADDVTFKDGIGLVMPDGWSAYIDEQLSAKQSISFSAENEAWITVLARIGSSYGYKFVVDWEQRLVQISKDKYYIEPDPNEPIITEGNNGQKYYIYKSKQDVNKGMVIVDGQLIPLKISN